MMARDSSHMFNFTYEKTAEEITRHAATKTVALLAKIDERQKRIDSLRKEHDIDDAALVQLFAAARRQSNAHQYSYASNSRVGSGSAGQMEERTIGAGVVNHLLTENDFLDADRASMKQLAMIIRNLRPLDRITASGTTWKSNAFQLSAEELEFLGF